MTKMNLKNHELQKMLTRKYFKTIHKNKSTEVEQVFFSLKNCIAGTLHM